MKNLILIASALLPLAAQAKMVCAQADFNGHSIQVEVTPATSDSPALMKVFVNAALIMQKTVAKIDRSHPDRIYFHTRNFLNSNNAPSSLLLLAYREGDLPRGDFSEISYLPSLPKEVGELAHNLICGL